MLLATAVVIPGEALAASPPGVPLNLTATASGVKQITLTWNAPASDGGAPITDYWIYGATSAVGPYLELAWGVFSSRTVDINWWISENGATYYFKIHARNSAGHGANTTAASATTWKEPTAPLSPSASRSVSSGPRTDVTLSWSPPSNNGGTAVNGYTVGINSVPDRPYWGGNCSVVGSSPCTEIQVGEPGETYYFWIAACNVVGCGPWSSRLTVAMFNYPNAPPTPTVTTGLNPGELGVSWSSASSDMPIDAYLVYRAATTTGSFSQVHNAGTSFSWTEGGLENGATWCYAIQAQSEVGYSPLSGAACGITLRAPGAPQNLQAVPGIDRSFLHWQAGDAGDRPVTEHQVKRAQGGSAPIEKFSPFGPSTIYTEELPGGIAYTYSVRALSAVGFSPYSNEAIVTPFGAGTGSGGGNTGWSTRLLANVDNQTVVPELPGGSVATIHVYNESASAACVDVTVNSVRQNVVCWARGLLGPLDAEIDRGDTPVGGSVAAATLSIRAEYRFNGPRLWFVAGAGGAADAFAPVGSGDAEWWANSGSETALTLYASVWSNGVALRQEILSLPYLGQALAAAEYSAGTQP
jgi:hypothetical protein